MSSSQDLLLVVSAAVSSILILIGSGVSIHAARHYREAQTVVRAVITTYSQRLTHQEEACQMLSAELGDLERSVEKLDVTQRKPYDANKQTTMNVADLALALKDTSANIKILNEALRAVQQSILNPTLVDLPRLSLNESHQQMTNIEIETIKILEAEGRKTSRELQGRLGRSREHFARLMKRLYERGYVDRDTSQIPFVYKINERMAHKVSEGALRIEEDNGQ